MSDRTIGILGLGIFGSSVLAALAKQDMNIIAIDDHAERINQFEPVLARGVIGDITDEELLRSAGIDTGQSLSKLDLRGKYNLNILGFREQENSPLDVEFGPDDLLKADTYILAVINNQYLDTLVALNS